MCRGPFNAAPKIWKSPHSRSSSFRELRQLGCLFPSRRSKLEWDKGKSTLPKIGDQNYVAALAASCEQLLPDANPSLTFQVRLAEGGVLGVGGEVEGLSGFVSIPLNVCSYSAVVGSITDRIREIRLAGKPPCWACLRTASSSGATYMQ